MCLIVFAWKVIPGTPLLLLANRDEWYSRPAAAADWWQDYPSIYGGRDLQSGGTWLGMRCRSDAPEQPELSQSHFEKIAAITNIRNGQEAMPDAPSRGHLVADFLKSELTINDYLARLNEKAQDYPGFNLLLGDAENLVWYSNRFADDARNGKALAPGVYGLSNAALDTNWHKVLRTKAELCSMLCQCAPDDAYFELLGNTHPAPDCRLPDTGVPFATERMLSAACIVSEDYGTRVSTLVKLHQHAAPEFKERLLR